MNNKKIIAVTCVLIVIVPLLIILLLVPIGGNSPLIITVYRTEQDELAVQGVAPIVDEQVIIPTVPVEEEMRAVWVGYPDYTNKIINEEYLNEVVSVCKANGMNTIIFHVRPFGDALYDSDYFPWSHFLSGEQGRAPADGFDPLSYIVELAHENGIEVHAWINPLRIQLEGGNVPSELSSDNPYNVYRRDADTSNDHFVIDYNDGKYYNIGESAVRELIVNGIAEIAAEYDVDGIHWDDYFYPASDDSFDDSVSYNAYAAGGGKLSLLEWRTQNVDLLVRDSYKAVKAVSPDCVFGISPQGNVQNCLNAGANVYQWCSSEGYIDYICPQLYWAYDYSVAPFEAKCTEWRQMITNEEIKLYIGLGLYNAGSDAHNGAWLTADDNLARELIYARNAGAGGFMLYSYRHLASEQTRKEMNNLKTLLQ